jgi:TolB-like protein/Tfp pilus assembly protein PilF
LTRLTGAGRFDREASFEAAPGKKAVMAVDLRSLRDRKLFHWALAYLAAAWLVMQAMEVFSDRWPLSIPLMQAIDVALVAGFFVALVLAWYHGEKGRQRVSGPELLLLALLLGIGGGLVGMIARSPVSMGGEGAPWRAASLVPLRAVLVDNPAVAILPLENFGAAEDASFVDGLHDDILCALQQIGGLTVIARSSVLGYREKPAAIPDVARTLGVDAVGAGTVSRAGGRIRVNIQLIHGATGVHLWAEQYDRGLTAENVFAIRSEIAWAVARALMATLTPQEEARLAAVPTGSITAFERLQAAVALPISGGQRAGALRKVLAVDSLYADAWAELAVALVISVAQWGAAPAWADSAEAAARRALALDPFSAVAYRALGATASTRGHIRVAEEQYRRALEIDPGSAASWNNLGVTAHRRWEMAEALDAYHRAIRLQPTNFPFFTNAGELYAELGLHEQARDMVEAGFAVTVNPMNRSTGFAVLAISASRAGDLNGAKQAIERAVSANPDHLSTRVHAAMLARVWRDSAAALEHGRVVGERAPHDPSSLFAFGYALQWTGDREAGAGIMANAATAARALVDGGTERWEPRLVLAQVAAATGNRVEALRWLQEAHDHHYCQHWVLELDPIWDEVRDDPAFRGLLVQMRRINDETRRRVLEMDAEIERARQERRAPGRTR